MMKIVIALILSGILVVPAMAQNDHRGDILTQKKELERIQEQVKEGRRKLDSLQQAEVNMSKRIAEYDQKVSSDRKLIGRLNRELGDLKQLVSSAQEELEARRLLFEQAERRYLGSLRQFYFAASPQGDWLTDDPNHELQQERQARYLTALASYETQNIAEAASLIADANDQIEDLSGKRQEVVSLKKKKETSVALGESKITKEEKDLASLRRHTQEEADRILTLKKAAEEMSEIVARLERKRQEALASQAPRGPSAFATLKGQLPAPFSGKTVTKFGDHTDPITRLKSFSPGITIEGSSRGMVRSVASGSVAYAGELRGYGKFVIINHDNQYYTTYASLGQILVSEGQYVPTQAELGRATADGQIKFEIRKGREPQDPVEWIRIDAL